MRCIICCKRCGTQSYFRGGFFFAEKLYPSAEQPKILLIFTLSPTPMCMDLVARRTLSISAAVPAVSPFTFKATRYYSPTTDEGGVESTFFHPRSGDHFPYVLNNAGFI